ncbi:4-hydroxy-tetrahydrodipicolinate synthase [Sporosarcina sp. BI001-red]|uniref:4-hydroxy-tetrahydrodipicolinate synthase n=1 Tax=Sporosarcina sp. BI001-red TaxID=2282866 RepID=UPI000E25D99E|nr:4-hydroxy-tetrahydrodipicolinate synthase [Sporosarcina sp. BI001-red]REB09806.1 4-hydroxy-tetrahydrodipicolinate synthase [Sporosarcina sp. BI001-red]
MKLGSVGTAMVTPFNDKGEIDYEVTTLLINHLIENGTDSLIVNGTTGESPTLSEEEKEQLLAHSISIADGRISVIAGTGSNDTQASIRATIRAEQLGADGVMLVVPYYNKPDQNGMYEHFKTIAENTSLPVLLYNIPGRSGVNLSAETVIRLSKITNIVAVKEASGDLAQMAAIIEGTDDGFSVYSGDDALTLPLLAIGGSGVISVSSHIVGLEMQRMIYDFHNGNTANAAMLHLKLMPLFQAVFSKPNPVPIKYFLKMAGLPVGDVRLPLVGISDVNSYLDLTMQTFKQQFDLKME